MVISDFGFQDEEGEIRTDFDRLSVAKQHQIRPQSNAIF
jgi:hypothetical protein